MRVYTLTHLLFLFSSITFAQIDVKTHHKKMDYGYQLYVDNNEFCPISIRLNFKLNNLESSDGNQKIYIIPAKTKQFKLSSLKILDKSRLFKVNISTNYNYGNHFLKVYDEDFEYSLPYQKGESYELSQGYNGNYSHQNKYQLDFKMPIGTKILAARGGTIIKVVDANNRQCKTQACERYNNYIYVYHHDGTIAEYVHIKHQSAKVNVGDMVDQDQVIAESGNVGWTNGPHLHFSVFIQRLEGKREYIKTKFRLKNGSLNYLKEKETYVRK